MRTGSVFSEGKVGIWIVLTLGGVFLLQFMTRQSAEKRIPGLQRGDIAVVRETLPDNIDGWKCRGFEAALPPDKLPEGQFWWTHSWQYQKNSLNAVIAFDQADWKSWHELTVCYQAVGWTLSDRQVLEVEALDDTPWPVVVARLERPPHQKATVVFSLFDQDGNPIASPFAGLPQKKTAFVDRAVQDNLKNRLTYNPDPASSLFPTNTAYDRLLQSQVFAEHSSELSEEEVLSLIHLHQRCRSFLRSSWLERPVKPLQNTAITRP